MAAKNTHFYQVLQAIYFLQTTICRPGGPVEQRWACSLNCIHVDREEG